MFFRDKFDCEKRFFSSRKKIAERFLAVEIDYVNDDQDKREKIV